MAPLVGDEGVYRLAANEKPSLQTIEMSLTAILVRITKFSILLVLPVNRGSQLIAIYSLFILVIIDYSVIGKERRRGGLE